MNRIAKLSLLFVGVFSTCVICVLAHFTNIEEAKRLNAYENGQEIQCLIADIDDQRIGYGRERHQIIHTYIVNINGKKVNIGACEGRSFNVGDTVTVLVSDDWTGLSYDAYGLERPKKGTGCIWLTLCPIIWVLCSIPFIKERKRLRGGKATYGQVHKIVRRGRQPHYYYEVVLKVPDRKQKVVVTMNWSAPKFGVGDTILLCYYKGEYSIQEP